MAPAEDGRPSIAGLHHVGIIVADLNLAVRFATELLGLEVDRRLVLEAESTEIAFVRCGDVMLELIEIADADVRSRRTRVPGAEAEIEHVALSVDDLDASVAWLSQQGVAFTAGAGRAQTTTEPLEVGGTRTLFTTRSSSVGLLVQLIEDAASPRERDEERREVRPAET